MSSIDDAKQRAEISSTIFSDGLRYFVRRWAPEDMLDLHDFHMDLTKLMVDAMRHKSNTLGYGIATYAEATFAEMAMHPLRVIRDEARSPQETTHE